MTLNRVYTAIVVFASLARCGCSYGGEEHTWVSITENGDKPGIAYVLIEKAGKVTRAKFCILGPNHPHDLSRGKCYTLTNLSHSGNTIKGDVSIVDGSSAAGTKEIHLILALKEALKAAPVHAEVQEEGATKQEIVLERK